jgi:glutamate-1-semialdehyde 2,1-aminomutase
LREALGGARVPWCLNRVGSMWTVFFGVDSVADADGARRCDTSIYAQWFRGMLGQGIYLPPSQFEAAFVSLAHGEDEIYATARAAGVVAKDLG